MQPPRWHNDRELLAAVAAVLRDGRIARDAELVDQGSLESGIAAARKRVSSAIADAWRAIAAVEPAPADVDNGDAPVGAWPFERLQLLEATAKAARATADAQPHDPEVTGYADAVDTLLWWEAQRPSARFLVDATIVGRARANADPAVIADRAARERRVEARRAAAANPALFRSLNLFGEAA
jgi:hypothetical protein